MDHRLEDEIVPCPAQDTIESFVGWQIADEVEGPRYAVVSGEILSESPVVEVPAQLLDSDLEILAVDEGRIVHQPILQVGLANGFGRDDGMWGT